MSCSLRSLARGDQHHAGKCAVQSVSRSQNGKFAHFEHGQDHDSCERGNLRHDRRRGDHLRGSEPTPCPQAAYSAQHRSDKDGRPDHWLAGQLLFERRPDAQSRWALIVDGYFERLQYSERVGPGVSLQ